MIADEKFNKRGVKLINCEPLVKSGPGYAQGICLELASNYLSPDCGDLRIHMNRDEAVALGIALIRTATEGQL